MIIPMKKVSLLCLEQDKSEALEQLRKLGLMQLIPAAPPESADIAVLTKSVADAVRAEMLIQSAEKTKHVSAHPCKDGAEVVRRTLELAERHAEAAKKLDVLERQEEQLAPWGEFDPSALEQLRKDGVYVTLCVSSPSVFENREFPAGAACEVIRKNKQLVCYVLISAEQDLREDPEAVTLPDITLDAVRKEIRDTRKVLTDADTGIAELRQELAVLAEYKNQQSAALEFATARDGMEAEGALAWLTGFVPETDIGRLRSAALECGWALLIEEPGEEDLVPTYIRKPKFLNIIDPLFDFIGVEAGYRENDVNAFFLLFFPVFFGMILGDAGYGVLFLIGAIAGKIVLRGSKKAQLPLNLFILLSISAVIWGGLSGAWFGITKSCLPEFMRGLPMLSDPASSSFARKIAEQLHLIQPGMTPDQQSAVYASLPDKFVQFFCFLLAAVHLGSARLFKFFDEIPRTWRAIGHLGWAALIVANSFMAVDMIVFPGTFPGAFGYGLYIGGCVLVILTTCGVDFLNLPFSLIGSFVDVLSYIRLFAVGLAGAYIAINFNKMGLMVMDALPESCFILGIILCGVIAVFGHVLNIALCLLGVMVHGIRLNTLEFSNHVGMQWAGIKYRPFAVPENHSASNQ